jgi:hypothetical protein
MEILLVIVWLILCVSAGMFASNHRNRSGGWFLIAFFFSPLVAYALLVGLPTLEPRGGTVYASN